MRSLRGAAPLGNGDAQLDGTPCLDRATVAGIVFIAHDTGGKMETLEAIHKRCSLKAHLSERAIEPDKVNTVLGAACLAPSARNKQPSAVAFYRRPREGGGRESGASRVFWSQDSR